MHNTIRREFNTNSLTRVDYDLVIAVSLAVTASRTDELFLKPLSIRAFCLRGRRISQGQERSGSFLAKWSEKMS